MAVLKKPSKAVADTSKLKALTVQEQMIKDGVESVAQSLVAIRDQSLYAAKGYIDFTSYCKSELNFSSSWVSRQISAAETKKRISESCDAAVVSKLPMNERQLRELGDVTDKDLPAVLDEAIELASEKNTNVTASVLSKAKKKVRPESFATTPPSSSKGSLPIGQQDDGLDDVERRAKEIIADRMRSVRLQFGNLLMDAQAEPHIQALEKLAASA